ncbi:MAG: toxin [Patescibacteria group bacterium]
MAYSITFNEEKNQLLKVNRGICFRDVVEAIESGGVLDDRTHHDSSCSHQKLLIVEINSYAYVAPYVLDEKKNEMFLKTVYPSRDFTKQYLRGGKDDK